MNNSGATSTPSLIQVTQKVSKDVVVGWEMPHVCQVMFTGRMYHCIIFFLDRARLILIPLRLLQLPELLR